MVVIDAKVKSENYDLVLNKSGQGTHQTPIVLYGGNKLDFTDDVIAALNRNRPVPTGSPGK